MHVISLPFSEARRAAIRSKLELAGAPVSFLEGIEGCRGTLHFERVDREAFRINTGRAPSDGEIGCYASHLSLWQRCVREGAPLVVLEDDATFSPKAFAAALDQVERWIDPYGFVRLQTDGPWRRSKTVLVERSAGFDLLYCARYPYGAAAYAIAPGTARAFVAASRTLRGPVDLFIKRFWAHGQPLFALSPAPVEVGALAAETTIDGRAERACEPRLRLHRSLARIQSAVSRARANRHNLARLRRGLIGSTSWSQRSGG